MLLQVHRGRFLGALPIGHLLCLRPIRVRIPQERVQRIFRHEVQLKCLHVDSLNSLHPHKLYPEPQAVGSVLDLGEYHYFCIVRRCPVLSSG